MQVGMTVLGQERDIGDELLRLFPSCFSNHQYDIGRTHLIEHAIATTGDPIRQHVRTIPQAQRKVVQQMLQEMLDHGIITRSQSPWASPIVLVHKKDNSIRLCVDYRKLNEITKRDATPIPRIDEILSWLHGARFFSTLDMTSAYWQVPVKEEDQEKTAFITPMGLFEFKVLPFQRGMETMLAKLIGKCCVVYLDDIVVFGKTKKEHDENLKTVRRMFNSCRVFWGFVTTTAISSIGFRRLPPHCTTFTWTPIHTEAFETLKTRLAEKTLLSIPGEDDELVVDTDASGQAIAVAFMSRKLSKAEQNYDTTRKEMLALVWTLKKSRFYLLGRKFRIRTDHKPLLGAITAREQVGQMARWITALQQFDFIISHRSGRFHVNADALSRNPQVNAVDLHETITQLHRGYGGGHLGAKKIFKRNSIDYFVAAK